MTSQNEYRQMLLERIERHYQAICACDKRLDCKKYKKKHRDPNSKVAVKQAEDRAEILLHRRQQLEKLLFAYRSLPEVTVEKQLEMEGVALRFAKLITKRRLDPQFLPNQRELVTA